MPGKKRIPQEMETITQERMVTIINGIPNDRNKALASFIYLTGCRISEILGTTKTLKNGKQYIINPLKTSNVEIIHKNDMVLIHNVACLKHKTGLKYRNIPIIMSAEKELLDNFLYYYSSLPVGAPLFKFKRQRAWQIIKKELGLFNHYLIHQRCTYLATEKNFSEMDLKQFRGWSTTQMASTYTHLKYTDVANKMR